MATPNSHPPTEDPVALIKARIMEKRIFEARFLLRQFGDEIAADRKKRLADELAATLSRAEQMLQRARAHAAGGERSQAEQMYREIEAIVIDMPGVAEEIKALAGASALIAKIRPKAPIVANPEPSPPEEENEAVAETESVPAAAGLRTRRWSRWPLWLAAGCMLLIMSLLALWYGDVKDTSRPPATPRQPVQKILIRPMVADGPAPTGQVTSPPPVAESTAERALEPSAVQQSLPQPTDAAAPKPVQSAQAAVPPPPTVRLGTLQIEQSAKK